MIRTEWGLSVPVTSFTWFVLALQIHEEQWSSWYLCISQPWGTADVTLQESLPDAPAMNDQVAKSYIHPAVFKSRSLFAVEEDAKLPVLFSELKIVDNFISWNWFLIL